VSAILWGILTSRLAGPVATGLAVLLFIAICVQAAQLSGVKRDLSLERRAHLAAERDLGTARTNTVLLQSAIEQQNAAVAALKKASDAKVAQAEAALRIASAKRANAEARAAALLHTPLAGATELERMTLADELVLRGLQ
jgi:hypothetical protein